MQLLFNNQYNKLIFISFLVFLITAYFSVGYFHPDEHFQILEFCNYKLGKSPSADLPWEFHEKMRPALQPIIALLLIKALNIFSLTNPFTYSLIFRIITAILSWFVICKSALLLMKNFSSEMGKKIFLFLSLLSGFVPFLSVRFSSETYSAIAFLDAVYFIIKYRTTLSERTEFKMIFTGLLLGFSFFFRFQIAFAIIGLVLWLVIINKTKFWNLVLLAISGTAAMIVCVVLDSWFYGQFTFTPYNYYFANIIQNKISNFGVQPWWFYLDNFSDTVFLPFGILLLSFFFYGLLKKPKDVFVWCLVPFLLSHFILGHKELRFLFPVTFGFIYIVTIGIDNIINIPKIKRYGQLIFVLIVIVNLPSLLYNMILPADDMLSSYQYLYNKPLGKETVFLKNGFSNLTKWGLKRNFYNSPIIKCIEVKDGEDFRKYLATNKSDTIYVLENNLQPVKEYNGYSNKCVFKLYPDWILWFNFNNWESRTSIINIQQLIKN
jgi:GPI mannosyltransferase 3